MRKLLTGETMTRSQFETAELVFTIVGHFEPDSGSIQGYRFEDFFSINAVGSDESSEDIFQYMGEDCLGISVSIIE